MPRYELVIEKKQPICGGRTPRACEIRSVVTDDPVEYVKKIADSPITEITNNNGVILIRCDRGKEWETYEFTED